jgi:hypothetical protein
MMSDNISLVVRRANEIGYRPITLFCAVVDSRSVAGALVSSYMEWSSDSVCRDESVRECQRYRHPAQQDLQQFCQRSRAGQQRS